MKRNYNRFWLFCCSLLPGAGYMYLGLMRRGVEAMLLFMLGIVIPIWLHMPELSAIIVIPLWFYCFFDTFYQRNNLEAGIDVEDRGFIDLLEWVNANYHLLGIGLIVLGVLAMFNTLGQWYYSNDELREVIQHVRGYVPPVLLIAAGIYLLRRTKKAEANIEKKAAIVNTLGELAAQSETAAPEDLISEDGHKEESGGQPPPV